MVYLVFNAGYSGASSGELVEVSLCAEAVRLARLLAGLMPDEPEVLGLLALLLLIEARRPARTAGGALVLLADQDRSRWDLSLVGEGQELVRRCLRRNVPGPYQIQAAINAVHCDPGDTDWRQIVTLYDHLLVFLPSPVVALNRAVAVAELHGPVAGLAAVQELNLSSYQPYHVARAELLVRLRRPTEAISAYDEALLLTTNAVERDHLARRRELA